MSALKNLHQNTTTNIRKNKKNKKTPINYYFDKKYLEFIKTTPFTKESYDLSSKKQRYEYFKQKIGNLIDDIKEALYKTNIVLYLIAPKFAGKGTYTHILLEILGYDKFHHLSVGDIVRDFPKTYKQEKQKILDFLKKDYRGEIPLKQAIDLTINPDLTKTLPDSFILSILKYEISKKPKKSLIIDGFPRTQDQITYTLLFRQLIEYKDDIDMFVLINVPYSILDARAKYRVVCPKCHNSRNLRYLPTEQVGYDKTKKEFYLICDNPTCNNQRMTTKPGDELGIKKYENRIIKENNLMNLARNMHGVSKIELFNAIPVELGDKYLQKYELSMEYSYTYENNQVKKHAHPWIIKENNQEYYSLEAAPATLQIIKQLHKILGL